LCTNTGEEATFDFNFAQKCPALVRGLIKRRCIFTDRGAFKIEKKGAFEIHARKRREESNFIFDKKEQLDLLFWGKVLFYVSS